MSYGPALTGRPDVNDPPSLAVVLLNDQIPWLHLREIAHPGRCLIRVSFPETHHLDLFGRRGVIDQGLYRREESTRKSCVKTDSTAGLFSSLFNGVPAVITALAECALLKDKRFNPYESTQGQQVPAGNR